MVDLSPFKGLLLRHLVVSSFSLYSSLQIYSGDSLLEQLARRHQSEEVLGLNLLSGSFLFGVLHVIPVISLGTPASF